MENSVLFNGSKDFIIYQFLRRSFIISILIILILLFTWGRAYIGSIKNYVKGKEFFDEQNYIKAVTFFNRSLKWYTPLNPYINKSAEYLWHISENAESIGDIRLSLIAIEAIKSGYYSSRSFYSPGKTWINRCEEKIRTIMSREYEQIVNDFDGEDYIYNPSVIHNDPNIYWTIILEIGLLGWIGAVLGLVFFCLNKKNSSNRLICSYWFWSLLTGVNYCLWVLGMIKA